MRMNNVVVTVSLARYLVYRCLNQRCAEGKTLKRNASTVPVYRN